MTLYDTDVYELCVKRKQEDIMQMIFLLLHIFIFSSLSEGFHL